MQLAEEVSDFSLFVTSQLDGQELSLEESLAAYRAYQSDLAKFKQDVAPAIAELDSGKATPLDIDAIIARGRVKLAEEGFSN